MQERKKPVFTSIEEQKPDLDLPQLQIPDVKAIRYRCQLCGKQAFNPDDLCIPVERI